MNIQCLFRGEGSDRIRIPTVVSAPDGSLYAFANVRVNTCRDDAPEARIIFSMKKPSGGWTEPRVLAEHPDWSFTVGSAVCDDSTGKILCFFHKTAVVVSEFGDRISREERDRSAREKEKRDGILEGTYVLETYDGISFRERPLEIVPHPKASDGFLFGSTHGSSSGITLKYGAHAGRLLCPARMSLHEIRKWEDLRTGSTNTVLYSDDHGETFRTGGVVEPGTGEGTLLERSDGMIYYNSRAYFDEGLRHSALSADGGETFCCQATEKDLIEPCCNGAVLRADLPGGTVCFFSNPHSTKDRIDMSLHVSFDEGRSWKLWRTVDHRFASYSCMAYDRLSGSLFLLYECGKETCIDEIDVCEFTSDDLMELF